MSEPAVTISPDASIGDAALLMIDKKIGCLPVVEGGFLVGLLTETDVLGCVVRRSHDSGARARPRQDDPVRPRPSFG